METTTPKPADAGRPKAASAEAANRLKISGESLLPSKARDAAVELVARYYWIGALPSLPCEHADIGGIHFPKLQEHVIRTPDGDTRRVPKIGSLVRLTRQDIEFLASRMPRTVVRFSDREDDIGEDGHRSGITDVLGDTSAGRRRRGVLITIPTQDEVQRRREAGLPTNLYQRHASDEPVARHLFAVPCGDQEAPSRGEHYPDPLSATGLVWEA